MEARAASLWPLSALTHKNSGSRRSRESSVANSVRKVGKVEKVEKSRKTVFSVSKSVIFTKKLKKRLNKNKNTPDFFLSIPINHSSLFF